MFSNCNLKLNQQSEVGLVTSLEFLLELPSFLPSYFILSGFRGNLEVNLMDMILVLRKLLINGRKIYRGGMHFRSTSSNIVIFYIDLNYYVKNRIDSWMNKKVMGAAKIQPF